MEARVNRLENRMDTFETKVDMYMQRIDDRFKRIDEKFEENHREMQDFKNEIRDRDNQRHAEIMEMRQEMSNTRKWIIGMAVATVLSAVAVGGSVIFGMLSMINTLTQK